jgi:hypothetical protein
MIMKYDAIFALYPNVTVVTNDVAFDADGNQVTYDLALVQAEQAAEAKRQEALAYLASTDYMMTADYDKDTTEVRALRAEARNVIRGVN